MREALLIAGVVSGAGVEQGIPPHHAAAAALYGNDYGQEHPCRNFDRRRQASRRRIR